MRPCAATTPRSGGRRASTPSARSSRPCYSAARTPDPRCPPPRPPPAKASLRPPEDRSTCPSVPEGQIGPFGTVVRRRPRPERRFRHASHWSQLVAQPAEVPRLLRIVVQQGRGLRGGGVLLLPGDVPGHHAEHWSPLRRHRSVRRRPLHRKCRPLPAGSP